jgi:hypothetical protein
MFSNMGCFWGFSTCWLQTQPPATPIARCRWSLKASVHLTTGSTLVILGASGSLSPFLSFKAFHCSEKFLLVVVDWRFPAAVLRPTVFQWCCNSEQVWQLGFGPKHERWCWNCGTCCHCRVGIRHPCCRASWVNSSNLLGSVFVEVH